MQYPQGPGSPSPPRATDRCAASARGTAATSGRPPRSSSSSSSLAGFVTLQAVTWGRVGDGVTVAGVSLQGLDRAGRSGGRRRRGGRAARARSSCRPARAAPRSYTLAQLGISVDAGGDGGEGVRRGPARAAARPRGVAAGRRRRGRAGGARRPRRVPAGPRGAARRRWTCRREDARLKLVGERLAVVPARAGREVDAVALERAILASLAAGRPYAGPVPMQEVKPEVTHGGRRGPSLGRRRVPGRAHHPAVSLQGGRPLAGADGRHALGQHRRRRRRVPAHLPQRPRRGGAPPAVRLRGDAAGRRRRRGQRRRHRARHRERVRDGAGHAGAHGRARRRGHRRRPAHHLRGAHAQVPQAQHPGCARAWGSPPSGRSSSPTSTRATPRAPPTSPWPPSSWTVPWSSRGRRSRSTRPWGRAPPTAGSTTRRSSPPTTCCARESAAASASTRRPSSTPSSSPGCRWWSGTSTRCTSRTIPPAATPRWRGAPSTSSSATTPARAS